MSRKPNEVQCCVNVSWSGMVKAFRTTTRPGRSTSTVGLVTKLVELVRRNGILLSVLSVLSMELLELKKC